MTDSDYKLALRAAADSLPPVPADIHPAAQEEFANAKQAAAEAIVDEKDPQKAAKMRGLYSQFLHDYGNFARQSDARVRAKAATYGRPLTPQESRMLLQEAQTLNYAFFNKWYSQHMRDPAENELLDKLGQKMRGPNMFVSMVYDERKARQEDSTLAGVKWGAIAGGVGGFLAGGLLGVQGVWGWIIRGAGAVAGAFLGNYLQKQFTGEKEEDTRVVSVPYRQNMQPQFGPQPAAEPQADIERARGVVDGGNFSPLGPAITADSPQAPTLPAVAKPQNNSNQTGVGTAP